MASLHQTKGRNHLWLAPVQPKLHQTKLRTACTTWVYRSCKLLRSKSTGTSTCARIHGISRLTGWHTVRYAERAPASSPYLHTIHPSETTATRRRRRASRARIGANTSPASGTVIGKQACCATTRAGTSASCALRNTARRTASNDNCGISPSATSAATAITDIMISAAVLDFRAAIRADSRISRCATARGRTPARITDRRHCDCGATAITDIMSSAAVLDFGTPIRASSRISRNTAARGRTPARITDGCHRDSTATSST